MKNVNCEKHVQMVMTDGIFGTFGFGSHVSLVESPDTSPGIFDMNAAFQGRRGPRECWIELKYACEDEQVFKLRPTQYKWCKNRLATGADNLYLMACIHVDDTDYWCLWWNESILDLKHHTGMDKKTLRRLVNLAGMMWKNTPDWRDMRVTLSS